MEAMRRQGIINSELWYKNDKELKEYYNVYDISKASMDIRREHYEERRKEKI